MKINIKETDIKLGKPLKEWVIKKVGKLEKFKDLFKDGISKSLPNKKRKSKIEIWLEVGKESFHHREGKVYRAEAQMRFPKKSIRAVTLGKNLKTAVISLKKKLERQLGDYKDFLVDKQKKIKK